MVTFIGPFKRFSWAGFTFYKDEARTVPPEVARQLTGHRWFSVEDTRKPRKSKDGNQG